MTGSGINPNLIVGVSQEGIVLPLVIESISIGREEINNFEINGGKVLTITEGIIGICSATYFICIGESISISIVVGIAVFGVFFVIDTILVTVQKGRLIGIENTVTVRVVVGGITV